jgi:hypothetical protein
VTIRIYKVNAVDKLDDNSMWLGLEWQVDDDGNNIFTYIDDETKNMKTILDHGILIWETE